MTYRIAPNAALGVGVGDVERHGRDAVGRGLAAKQDVAHDRTVAVREHHVRALGDQPGHVRHRVVGAAELRLDAGHVTGARDRVATERNDECLANGVCQCGAHALLFPGRGHEPTGAQRARVA